jgi:cell division protease FtsH
VHCKGKPLSSNVDLGIVAKRTIGFSGASLANLMNEAAIVAARRDKSEIGYAEVDFAIDRITVGMAKSTSLMSPQRQRLVAYHEAGHAIMGALTKDYDLVTKVTIVPRSNGAGGFTLFTPTEERMESGLYSRSYLESQLAVALGGRVAEEIVFGADEITTGASGDLQQVRNIARRMVAQWGFAKVRRRTRSAHARATPGAVRVCPACPLALDSPRTIARPLGSPRLALSRRT